jgi:SAM-dependent methyltransferase
MDRGPEADNITRKTYDRIAPAYSSRIDELVTGSWIEEFERELLDGFLRMVVLPEATILDIGCGSGRDMIYLRQKGAVVVGVDSSVAMLREARERTGGGVLCQMDMRKIGLSGGAFDGVWANGCIYHVAKAELAGVLGEVRWVLRPGGIFSYNFTAGRGERIEENPRSFGGGPRFFAYYTVGEMKGYLREAGFEVLEIKRYPEKILGDRIVQVTVRKT